jgi:hypothetical protein
MNGARVFVVQDDGSKDLVPATAYGDIVVLSSRGLSLFTDPTRDLDAIKRKLVEYRFTLIDWLLPIGDPLLIGAVTHFAAVTNGGLVNCLKWDNRHKKYFPIKLNL